MSQHDMVVDNASGATVRADINSALQALASTSAGVSRPSTAYQYQLWIDTNTPSGTKWSLYCYDGTDDILLGYIDSTNNRFEPAATAAVTDLTALTSGVDMANDLVAMYDNSASVAKKVAPDVLIGGVRPAFSANRNGVAQTLTAATWTKVQLTTEDFDTNSNFDSATNYRFTPTVAGKYLLTAKVQINSQASNSFTSVGIYKNGVVYQQNTSYLPTTGNGEAAVSAVVDANGSTDYFEMYAYNGDSGAASRSLEGTASGTRFTGSRLA